MFLYLLAGNTNTQHPNLQRNINLQSNKKKKTVSNFYSYEMPSNPERHNTV